MGGHVCKPHRGARETPGHERPLGGFKTIGPVDPGLAATQQQQHRGRALGYQRPALRAWETRGSVVAMEDVGRPNRPAGLSFPRPSGAGYNAPDDRNPGNRDPESSTPAG
jgi:hypothetical protein